MFREILKIIPQVDNNALNKMERNLGTRFTKVAKKFGSGLKNVLTKGGWIGIAIGLIDKLLNPLKETQAAIDAMLKSSDDIATNAEQFNTSAGKLFKLTKFAQAKGLDQEALFMLMTKFQSAVAEAQNDPTKDTSVREFVGQKDVADAFFAFIQNLNKLDREQQVLVQNEVFGEKQTLKIADFLRTDFHELAKSLGVKSADAYDPSINKLSKLNDLADVLATKNSIQDMENKARLINQGMIKSNAAAEVRAKQREDQAIANYKNLAAITKTTDDIMKLVQDLINQLGKFIATATPLLEKLIKYLGYLLDSPAIRLFLKGFGK